MNRIILIIVALLPFFSSCDTESGGNNSGGRDTLYVYSSDTLYVYNSDTIVVRDTLFINDTLYVFDSVYVQQNAPKYLISAELFSNNFEQWNIRGYIQINITDSPIPKLFLNGKELLITAEGRPFLYEFEGYDYSVDLRLNTVDSLRLTIESGNNNYSYALVNQLFNMSHTVLSNNQGGPFLLDSIISWGKPLYYDHSYWKLQMFISDDSTGSSYQQMIDSTINMFSFNDTLINFNQIARAYRPIGKRYIVQDFQLGWSVGPDLSKLESYNINMKDVAGYFVSQTDFDFDFVNTIYYKRQRQTEMDMESGWNNLLRQFQKK